MKISYRKSNGQVVSYGSEINNDVLETKEISLTSEEEDKIKNGKFGFSYEIILKNNKIKFIETEFMTSESKAIEEQTKKTAQIEQIKNAKDINELKQFIIDFIK